MGTMYSIEWVCLPKSERFVQVLLARVNRVLTWQYRLNNKIHQRGLSEWFVQFALSIKTALPVAGISGHALFLNGQFVS
jgi:hypothetical protein